MARLGFVRALKGRSPYRGIAYLGHEGWATLLDAGRYLGSISTFYRLLRQAGESKERRHQATHPATVIPELVAFEPNRVWSWDICKLRGRAKWSWYYLYVILDIFSRYVAGWMVAGRESAALAEVLIRQTCTKKDIAIAACRSAKPA